MMQKTLEKIRDSYQSNKKYLVIKTLIQLLPQSKLKERLLKAHSYLLRNIVVITGQNCSLKCKNCANFSPYLAKTIPFYPHEEICQDLQAITDECQILRLQLQGGEFFLHPNALQILEYIANNPRIHQVTIATNATMIPKDSLLAIIKQSGKISVRLSDYGAVNHKSAQRLEAVLAAHAIPYFTHHYVHSDSQWRDCGGKDVERLGDDVVQKIFDACLFGRNCLTMENGLISRCSRGVVAHIAQGFSMGAHDGILVRPNAKRVFATIAQTYQMSAGGGADNQIYLPTFDFLTLKNFLDNPSPMEACYYCYGTSGKPIPPGVQLTLEELKSISKTHAQD